MEKQIIDVPRKTIEGRPQTPLSQAVKAGDFVFVAGQPPTDFATGEFVQGDIEAQTRQCLENVKTVLEAAGSSMEKVVKVQVLCTNAAHFQRVNAIYRQYFTEDFPARTFVTVGSWPGGFDIEIECIAIAGDA